MQLPGGLYRQDGAVERGWSLRPLDGHLELALWDTWHRPHSKVDSVTRTIASTIDLPDGGEGDHVGAAGLSVADRQFLMAQLACHLGASRFWVSADCASCRQRFDAPIDLDRLPVKPAGEGYPFAVAETSQGTVKVRVPTGNDQAAIQHIANERQALLALAKRCVVAQAGRESGEVGFNDDDLDAIDEALQRVSSEVANAVMSSCPNCRAENTTSFDLSALLQSSLRNPLEEFHDIATAYHWGEGEILDLPRERRRQYLALIDRRRGMQE